ncbi:MAG: amidohydrolase family protein [Deltaproteobacteria bacterium]|nr:amidohydrolase family protein [Deltaproteobacteria bacterium]
MSEHSAAFDLVVCGGRVFDGKGGPSRELHLGIKDGRIAAASEAPFPAEACSDLIDAKGKWVVPGFVDLHTHYDAEIELSPGLRESVKHGVTTIVLGSCSLSLALGTPEDLADQFCRVEAIPYSAVRELLENRKTWSTLSDYRAHLGELALGPNVASFVGHSGLRAHVMGLERSLDRHTLPTEAELRAMEAHLLEGLEVGYLGLSIQTLKWDKMGGSRSFRSRPLPSTYARWSEVRRLNRHLRERGRIFQGVPNVTTKVNVFLFLLESVGIFRKPLRTTVISMMDTRANRGIHRMVGLISRAFNLGLGADFRWQALPEVFDLWADGIDLVVFEEFGAGAAALHLQDSLARTKLLREPGYRSWFKAQWRSWVLPKVFHRNFGYSEILRAPDATLVGKSFVELGRQRDEDPVDTFLELVATHGNELRWYTVMANDRTAELEWIVSHPDVLIGFSDAGAHLRNMAHYNFPLRLLKLVRDSHLRGRPCMSFERAVHRVSGEIAEWLGIDAGTLEVGKIADVVVLDPERLGRDLDVAKESPMEELAGFVRMVNQNGGAVETVLIGGKRAIAGGEPTLALGAERLGRVLVATR